MFSALFFACFLSVLFQTSIINQFSIGFLIPASAISISYRSTITFNFRFQLPQAGSSQLSKAVRPERKTAVTAVLPLNGGSGQRKKP
jgi:hypothetical protein